MDRRSFFGAAALTALFPARIFEGLWQEEEESLPRAELLQACVLAGFQFHDGGKVWADLREGDHLELVREPANPYDRRAVSVFWKGRKLGFIPRYENGRAASLMDQGRRLHATLASKREGLDPWQRIILDVWLQS